MEDKNKLIGAAYKTAVNKLGIIPKNISVQEINTSGNSTTQVPSYSFQCQSKPIEQFFSNGYNLIKDYRK
jgi:hypothetical protein